MQGHHVVALIAIVVLVMLIIALVWWLYKDKPIPTPSGGGGGGGTSSLAGITVPQGAINVPDVPLNPAGGSIVDCDKYGTLATGGYSCAPGALEYGGVCYTDNWTMNGGTKTAVCTVEYPGSTQLYTKCGIGIYNLDYGAPCTMLGPGWFKTAACTCQSGGEVTTVAGGLYCQSQGLPSNCPVGSDGVNGASAPCFSQPCPSGYKRTGRCTCSPV